MLLSHKFKMITIMHVPLISDGCVKDFDIVVVPGGQLSYRKEEIETVSVYSH